MRKPVFWMGLIGLLFALPAGWVLLHLAPKPVAPVTKLQLKNDLPTFSTLPPFALTDQDEHPFTREQLVGHVSIVNFIFTTCPNVCPMLSTKMATLQKRTQDLGSSVRLVSFSVDPETDTPAVLKSYGERYSRDPGRWSFVTGALAPVEAAISDGFKIALTRDKHPGPDASTAAVPVNGFDIVHGEQFVLVDSQARIRGYYHKDDADLDRLVHDAEALAGRRMNSQESGLGQR